MVIFGNTWNHPIEKMDDYYKSLTNKEDFKQLETLFH